VRILRRRWPIAGIVLAALAFAVISLAIAEAARYAPAQSSIALEAEPITSFDNRDPSRTRFGALEFRGGLVLTSENEAFGGFSGLVMDPDGEHFISVSDRGSWLRGRIAYRDGKPDRVVDAEIAPLIGADGTPLGKHGWFDAEALAESDGILFVGFERVEQIVRFEYRRDGLAARGEPIKVPPEFKTLSHNRSIECVAAPPRSSPLAGSLIVVTEHSLDAAGNHRGFLLKGDDAARFSVKRVGDFDVSDCAMLDSDTLLLLERSYSLVRGLGMRIRRVPLASIRPGALADGAPLIEADLGYQIDNMEGIGVHRNGSGETILTLVSDDNFSVFQRTLLLQFALVGE
jgi:hypothetical protein